MKRSKLLSSVLFGLVLPLSACAGAQNAADSSGASSLPETAPEETAVSESISPEEIPYDKQIYAVEGSPGLLDLSCFLEPEAVSEIMADVPDQSGGTDVPASEAGSSPWTCVTAALRSEEEILLVFDTGSGSYRCAVLNTEDGSYQPILSEFPKDPPEADVPEDGAGTLPDDADEGSFSGYGDYNSLQILSASPVVLYDYTSRVIYRPEEADGSAAVCPLPSDLEDVTPVYADDSVWLSTWSGFLYRFDADGSREPAWEMPGDYSWCYPELTGDDDAITFGATPLSDSQATVFLEVDPSTGATEAFTLEEDRVFPEAASDDVLCATARSSASPCIVMYDTAELEMKDLTLPASVGTLPDGSENYYLELARIPVCGDSLLFTETDYDHNVTDLYFWDTSEIPAMNWEPAARTPYVVERLDYGELSARADLMSETYGVSINIGENAQLTFPTYTAEPVVNEWLISSALDRLDAALSKYPPGYFSQLADGRYREIRVELVGPMTPIDPLANIASPSAVTFDEEGLVQIAFDIEMGIEVGTVCHEFSHILDHKLESAGLLDEEAWNALNPDGFDYYYSYIDEDGNDHQYDEDMTWTASAPEVWNGDYSGVYFYDNYSKTWPTEDRARIIEMLSDPGWTDASFRSPHLQEKARFIFDLVRSTFDTEGWPDATPWEEALERA